MKKMSTTSVSNTVNNTVAFTKSMLFFTQREPGPACLPSNAFTKPVLIFLLTVLSTGTYMPVVASSGNSTASIQTSSIGTGGTNISLATHNTETNSINIVRVANGTGVIDISPITSGTPTGSVNILPAPSGTAGTNTPPAPGMKRVIYSPANTDSFPPIDAIDQAVFRFMAQNNVPALSLAITQNEQLVYSKAYGFSDREKRVPLHTGNLFRIASISKPITSIAILKLAEQKKLSLDDRIFGPKGILKTRYGKQPYHPNITEITVRHLLQHLAGGWGNRKNDPMFTDPSRSIDELISFTLDNMPLENKPGTTYDYSNFGYCLLGRVIETLTGTPYDQYIKETLLAPMGIRDMSIGGNTGADRKDKEVKYYGQHGENPDCCNITRMDAHGGWIASANDLVRILSYVDGRNKVPDILNAASFKTMISAPAVSPAYACGWGVDTAGNFQHTGSLPGTRTLLRSKANGLGYAILTNTRSSDSLFNKGLQQLMQEIEHSPAFTVNRLAAHALPDFRPSFFADEERLSKLQAAFPVIENIYKDFAQKNHIPGLAFGIVGEGKLLYANAFGYSDVERQVPLSTASVFRIASMSKSFAGMAILMLRDAGKLQLDDPVSKFIPELKQVKPLTDDSPPITIRHLLSHSAGFPEDNPWADRQLERADEELLQFISKGLSLSNIPGLQYEYSNLGYAMLGKIITAASGMHYEKYINQNLFQPLGMTHTYWEYTEVPKDQLVHGYRRVNGKWREEAMLHRGAYGIMGGLLTSVEDFSRYMLLHLSAWPPRSGYDTGILKRSSVREMHLPGKLSGFLPDARNSSGEPCPRVSAYNFGLGWTKDCMGKEMIGHSGGLPGFGTHWVFLPEYGIGVVSFSSLTYAPNSALNFSVVDTLIALAGLTPRSLPVSTLLNERKNQLVKLLPDWQEAEQSGIFAENFFSDYFIDSLKKESRSLFAKAGRILRVTEMIPDNQLRGNFTVEGEHTDIFVRFTLSPENPGLIQQFIIREQPKRFGKYGLKTISLPEEYTALVKKDPSQELVALDGFIPDIQLEIRYAGSNNIMKRPLYQKAAAYMKRPAAEALKKIQEELRPLGYGLKIYDGYRPYRVTVIFYENFHDTTFVASPYTGSRHNRGCAVDLTLVNLKTGKELAMPTPYDSFTREAHSAYPKLSKKVLENRALLQRVMLKHGFQIYPDEWWHFDFAGWKKYPVMDIPFEDLPTR